MDTTVIDKELEQMEAEIRKTDFTKTADEQNKDNFNNDKTPENKETSKGDNDNVGNNNGDDKTPPPSDDFDPFEQEENKDDKNKDKKDAKEGDDKGEDNKENQDDEIDDEDAKLIDARIDKIISQRYADKFKKIDEQDVKEKVDTFLNNPDNEVYKDFKDDIIKYANNPRTKGMTMEAIARLSVNPRTLMKKGAELESKASEEAKTKVTQGSVKQQPKVNTGKLPNAWELSDEEFDKAVAQTMGMQL